MFGRMPDKARLLCATILTENLLSAIGMWLFLVGPLEVGPGHAVAHGQGHGRLMTVKRCAISLVGDLSEVSGLCCNLTAKHSVSRA